MADVPSDAEELYRLPPGEFTAARDHLAKELRAAGDKDGAAAVKAMRKPPNAAWALNHLAATAPDVIAGALTAGAAVRSASATGERDAILDATRAERSAREAAADAAMAALRDAELPASDAVRRQVVDTLHAALVDDDVAEHLQQGTLDQIHASSGFDLGVGITPAPSSPKPVARKPAKADNAAAKAEAKAEAKAQEQAQRIEDAKRARRVADAKRAEEKATRLERQADESEARAARARAEAVAARKESDELQRAATTKPNSRE